MDAPRLALATSSAPLVWLLNLDTGQAVPATSALDNGGAFDVGLARRGWTAVQVEYQVAAYPDGADLSPPPVVLPEAWEILPAATDDLVLFRPYLGRSGKPGELVQVAVAGPDGVVRRSATLPWTVNDHVVGEIEGGVVTWAGIYEWQGRVRPLPIETMGDPYLDPRPFAVLAGRVILFEGVDFLESVDTRSGARWRYPIPAEPRKGPFGARHTSSQKVYDAAGNWVAVARLDVRTLTAEYVVAGPDGQITLLPRRPSSFTMWVGDKLVFWNWDDGHATEYDPTTDRFSPADVTPMTYHPHPIIPRVEVTGRFDWPL